MACGHKMITVLLIIFNMLLFLFGVALAAVGIWSAVDKVYVSQVIGDDLFSAASYMVFIAGFILLGVAVFGMYAVRREKRLVIIIYFVLLLVIFLLLLLTAILAVVFKAELEEEMTDAMRTTVTSSYGSDSDITDAWDKLQTDLKCCGVRAESVGSSGLVSENLEQSRQDSWLLFQNTPWYRDRILENPDPVLLVPRSCCVYDEKISDYRDVAKCQNWQLGPPGNLRFAVFNNALHYDGCYEKAKQFVGEQADILVGCTFAFAFTLIGGLVLTLMLYRLLGQRARIVKD